MSHRDNIQSIRKLWSEIYKNEDNNAILEQLIAEVESSALTNSHGPQPEGWYKDAIVYSLYVDLFNGTFAGLTEKLPQLRALGVSCLWLLPILDSPMRDAGFDIRDYRTIRADLLDLPQSTSVEERQKAFRDFLDEAHKNGLKVIFDVAMNHTSEEHQWFVESRKGPDNPFRDYYIWN